VRPSRARCARTSRPSGAWTTAEPAPSASRCTSLRRPP